LEWRGALTYGAGHTKKRGLTCTFNTFSGTLRYSRPALNVACSACGHTGRDCNHLDVFRCLAVFGCLRKCILSACVCECTQHMHASIHGLLVHTHRATNQLATAVGWAGMVFPGCSYLKAHVASAVLRRVESATQ